MFTDFQNFFTVVCCTKFATKSMSYEYISSHFKGATPLSCKTQKTETGTILLHVMLHVARPTIVAD